MTSPFVPFPHYVRDNEDHNVYLHREDLTRHNRVNAAAASTKRRDVRLAGQTLDMLILQRVLVYPHVADVYFRMRQPFFRPHPFLSRTT